MALLLSLLLAPCTVPPSSQSPSHRGSEQPLWDNLQTIPPSSQVSAGTSPYTPLLQPRTATTKQTSSCEKWDYSSTAHQHPQAHTSQVQFSPCRSYKVPPTTHPCTFPVPGSPSPPTSSTAPPLYQHPCYNTAGSYCRVFSYNPPQHPFGVFAPSVMPRSATSRRHLARGAGKRTDETFKTFSRSTADTHRFLQRTAANTSRQFDKYVASMEGEQFPPPGPCRLTPTLPKPQALARIFVILYNLWSSQNSGMIPPVHPVPPGSAGPSGPTSRTLSQWAHLTLEYAQRGVIYVIYNVNVKKLYIGQTVLTLTARFMQHMYNARSNARQYPSSKYYTPLYDAMACSNPYDWRAMVIAPVLDPSPHSSTDGSSINWFQGYSEGGSINSDLPRFRRWANPFECFFASIFESCCPKFGWNVRKALPFRFALGSSGRAFSHQVPHLQLCTTLALLSTKVFDLTPTHTKPSPSHLPTHSPCPLTCPLPLAPPLALALAHL